MKILLLDDDATLGGRVMETLESMGYDVTFIRTAEEALKELAAFPPPDLCMLDIELEGQSQTGIDIARKSLKQSIPVILFSSYSNSGEYARQAIHARVPVRFFIDRKQATNTVHLSHTIEDAITTYDLPKPVSEFEYLNYATRKIGVRSHGTGSVEYRFVGKDEIVFIESDPDQKNYKGYSLIHTSAGEGNEIRIGCNIGLVVGQLARVFYNIIRLDKSYAINLEQIESLVGKRLNFTNGEYINMSEAAMNALKRHNLILNCQH